MKRYVIFVVSILLVLAVAWPLFAQEEVSRAGRHGGRRGMWREAQMQVIAAIEAEIAKMKTSIEAMPSGREGWRELSDKQRESMRERFGKIREERRKSVAVLEEQIAKLKGSRALTEEYDKALAKLEALHKLAVKEKAKETAASVEKLIAEKKKAFEDMLNKLGLEARRGRGPRGRE